MFSKMNGQEQAQRFLQTDFWADFKTAHGWKKYSFILSPDGTERERNRENQCAPDRTILSVLVRKFSLKFTAFYIAYVPMAPECANLEFIETVSANLKKYLPKNTIYIRFDPPVGFATATERDEAVEKLRHNRNTKARPASVCVQPPDTTILGLNKSCDELLAAMKSKWRYNIRLSQKNNSEKAYIATTTFGKSGQELIQMLQDGSQALKDYADEAKHLGIVVSDEDTLKAKSMGDTIQRLKDAVTGFSLAIGLKLIPYVEPVIASMTEWIATNREWIATEIASSVKDFVECIKKIDFKQVISQTVTFTKNLVKLFNYLGGVKTIAIVISTIFASKFVVALIGTISAFLKIATAIKAVTVATTLFNIALWSNPIVLIAAAIIAAIAAIVASVYFLYKNWDTVCKWCKDAWNAFVGFTMSTVTKIKAFFTKMITYILSSLSPIKKALNGIKNWLTNLFNDPVNTIKDTFLSLIDFYVNLWGNIRDVTESTLKAVFGEMISYVLNALSPIKAVWEDIKNWLSGLFNDPVNTIKETFLSLVDFYANLWLKIKDVFFAPFESAAKGISKIGSTLSNGWDKTKNFFGFGDDSNMNVPATTLATASGGALKGDININVKSAEGTTAEVESTSQHGDGRIQYKTNSGVLRSL